MNRFEKRNTVREIEIFGNTYNVDFGKDKIPFIFQKVADDLRKISEKDSELVIDKQKGVFKKAICDIIGDANAAKQIFKEDNTAILHSDVYTFLVNQYTEVMSDESPYNPKRAK